MSKTIQLTADDGHTFNAYESGDPAQSVAGLVVLQEIFGVNHHIRSVADQYAGEGFYALAPALLDRAKPGVELDYSPESAQAGRGFMMQIGMETALKDIVACIDHARRLVPSGKVGVIGYCLGGSLAWLSATHLNPDVAVGYYGGKVIESANANPHCPVMLHFGAQDQHIPVAEVMKLKEARPELPIYLYDAGHGFNCNERASYSPAAASLAFERSLAFMKETLHA
jgi:carboxymethylenebutenolidase